MMTLGNDSDYKTDIHSFPHIVVRERQEGLGRDGEVENGLIYGETYIIEIKEGDSDRFKTYNWKWHLTTLKDGVVHPLSEMNGINNELKVNDITWCGEEIRLVAVDPLYELSVKLWVHYRFRWFSRRLLAQEVANRKNFPWKVGQHTTPLCGMACLAYFLAKDHADQYGKIIFELHQYGFARYNYYEIRPVESVFVMNPLLDKGYPTEMPYSDWIFMVSLRNTESNINYIGTRHQVFSAISWPWIIQKLLKRFMGFERVEFHMFSLFKSYIRNYFDENRKLEILSKEIDKAYQEGSKIMLLVDSDMLFGKEYYGFGDFLKYHWIVYEGGLQLENSLGEQETNFNAISAVKFKSYTWGERVDSSRTTKGISKRAYIRNYYAYLKIG